MVRPLGEGDPVLKFMKTPASFFCRAFLKYDISAEPSFKFTVIVMKGHNLENKLREEGRAGVRGHRTPLPEPLEPRASPLLERGGGLCVECENSLHRNGTLHW